MHKRILYICVEIYTGSIYIHICYIYTYTSTLHIYYIYVYMYIYVCISNIYTAAALALCGSGDLLLQAPRLVDSAGCVELSLGVDVIKDMSTGHSPQSTIQFTPSSTHVQPQRHNEQVRREEGRPGLEGPTAAAAVEPEAFRRACGGVGATWGTRASRAAAAAVGPVVVREVWGGCTGLARQGDIYIYIIHIHINHIYIYMYI